MADHRGIVAVPRKLVSEADGAPPVVDAELHASLGGGGPAHQPQVAISAPSLGASREKKGRKENTAKKKNHTASQIRTRKMWCPGVDSLGTGHMTPAS